MTFEHYYTKKPTSALKFYNFKARIRGFHFELTTSTGVFSPKKVDKATKLLAENMIIRNNESFLDLGCGYGAVGITAARMGAKVVMSDVNERALMLAQKNIKNNKLSAEIVNSEGFANIKIFFDNICLNPPIAAGMKTCKSLIKESYSHLNSQGLLQIVARHKKGGRRLMEYMEELFSNVQTLAKKGVFRVYVSEKNI